MGVGTGAYAARRVFGRGGGVAHEVAFVHTIDLAATGVGVVKRVEEAQVVAHLVGEGSVEGSAGLQRAFCADDVVEEGDPVAHIAGGSGVGKALDATTGIVAVDFWHDKHVEVVVPKPRGQGFDLGLVCAREGLKGSDSVLCKARNARAVDPNNARGGQAVGRAFGQLKLHKHIDPQAVSIAASNLAEIFIQGVDGGQDLGVADVLLHPDGRAAMDDVHHQGEGVDFQRIRDGEGRALVPRRIEGSLVGEVGRRCGGQGEMGHVRAAGREAHEVLGRS